VGEAEKRKKIGKVSAMLFSKPQSANPAFQVGTPLKSISKLPTGAEEKIAFAKIYPVTEEGKTGGRLTAAHGVVKKYIEDGGAAVQKKKNRTDPAGSG